MRLWDATTLDSLRWPDSELGRLAGAYLPPILRAGVTSHVENAHGELHVLEDGDLVLPVIVTDTEDEDTYVLSFRTQYATYAVDEVRRHHPAFRAAPLCALPRLLGSILRAARIDRCVHVNNWLVSTPLHPEIAAGRLAAMTEFLVARFPDRAIVVHALNAETCGGLMDGLARSGYVPVFSRIVYLMPAGDVARLHKSARRHLRDDHRLFEASGYGVVPLTAADACSAERLQRLYTQLYVGKYSRLNPRYTVAWFRAAIAGGSLRFLTLRRDGRTDGVAGILRLGGVLTTPIFGYDTSLPQSLGLYRMLSAATLDLADRQGVVDHASSGVGDFKRVRGYRPTLEWTAVFARHLGPLRRQAWSLLEGWAKSVSLPRWWRYEVGSEMPDA
jgi:hypothetical protein